MPLRVSLPLCLPHRFLLLLVGCQAHAIVLPLLPTEQQQRLGVGQRVHERVSGPQVGPSRRVVGGTQMPDTVDRAKAPGAVALGAP